LFDQENVLFMSVEIEINLKGNEVDIPQIADLLSLRYGFSDANYVLEENGTITLHLPLP